MKNIAILLLALFSQQVYAQDIITTSGGEGGGVVWTIGGILTNTLSDNNATTVTQGFIQPEYAIADATGILEVNSGKTTITAVPNPVVDELSLSVREAGRFAWTLYNVLGQKLATGTVDNSFTTIPFSHYPAGQYVLKVTDAAGSQSLKIIK